MCPLEFILIMQHGCTLIAITNSRDGLWWNSDVVGLMITDDSK